MSRLSLLARAAVRNPLPVLWHVVKVVFAAAMLFIVIDATVYNISHNLFPLWTDVLFVAFFGLGMLGALIQFVWEAYLAIRSYLKPVADQAEGNHMPYPSPEAYERSRETDIYGQPVLF